MKTINFRTCHNGYGSVLFVCCMYSFAANTSNSWKSFWKAWRQVSASTCENSTPSNLTSKNRRERTSRPNRAHLVRPGPTSRSKIKNRPNLKSSNRCVRLCVLARLRCISFWRGRETYQCHRLQQDSVWCSCMQTTYTNLFRCRSGSCWRRSSPWRQRSSSCSILARWWAGWRAKRSEATAAWRSSTWNLLTGWASNSPMRAMQHESKTSKVTSIKSHISILVFIFVTGKAWSTAQTTNCHPEERAQTPRVSIAPDLETSFVWRLVFIRYK